MNTSPTERSRVLKNVRLAVTAWAGAAALLFALMQVAPPLTAWAMSPWITPLAATFIALVLGVAAIVLTTVVIGLMRREREELQAENTREREELQAENTRQRAELQAENTRQRDELEAEKTQQRDELEAAKAKNQHLESVLQELRIAAWYDVLTGVPNSRYLKHLLDDEQRSSDETRCLILLDLENFGEINKKHNHWKGDEYLSKFAAKLLDSSRRNEYVIKRRSTRVEDRQKIQAFRRYSGGDEFYILLNGPFVDGLGYLNRLHRRADEFEEMALEILGSSHHFGFRAGLTSVGYKDEYKTAALRACDALGKALEKPDVLVYWGRDETSHLNKKERNVVEEAIANFGDPLKYQ
jgi:diguanylate cyclase (GGDEF)-like protein